MHTVPMAGHCPSTAVHCPSTSRPHAYTHMVPYTYSADGGALCSDVEAGMARQGTCMQGTDRQSCGSKCQMPQAPTSYRLYAIVHQSAVHQQNKPQRLQLQNACQKSTHTLARRNHNQLVRGSLLAALIVCPTYNHLLVNAHIVSAAIEA